MKKTIISCTITLCGVICAIGYLIACSCGNGSMSSPLYYLDAKDIVVIAMFTIIAFLGMFIAIKDMRK